MAPSIADRARRRAALTLILVAHHTGRALMWLASKILPRPQEEQPAGRLVIMVPRQHPQRQRTWKDIN